MHPFTLLAGSSHPRFAEEVANHLETSLGRVLFEPFPDGEISLQVLDTVRGRDVFVIQSLARDPHNYLMEFLILVDALKRASVGSITAVLPYFCYARQDRKDKPRVPITGRLVADLLERAGISRVLTMDLHAGQIQGFFNVPVDNLYAQPLLAEEIRKEVAAENLVVMAPDLGAVKKARAYATHLKVEYGVIDKRRRSSDAVEVVALIGDVKGRDVLIVDDMCASGATLLKAAEACRRAGAKRLFAAFTHGLLVGEALRALADSPFERIYTTDTVVAPKGVQEKKFVFVSVAPLFGEAIRCMVSAESLSAILR